MLGKMSCGGKNSILKLPHHEQREFCTNRPYYRQGKKLTAVKVYTINDESVHLLVNNVPIIQLKNEIYKLCSRFGEIKKCAPVPEFVPPQEFTETYHVQYSRIQSARFAKRQIDGRSFFGSLIHVCYAPELETVDETRQKLVRRRCEVAARIQQNSMVQTIPQIERPRLLQRSKKHPALTTAVQTPYVTESNFSSNNVTVSPSLNLQNGNISEPCGDKTENKSTHEVPMESAGPKNSSLKSSSYDNKVIKFLPKPVAIQKRIIFYSDKK